MVTVGFVVEGASEKAAGRKQIVSEMATGGLQLGSG